MASFPEVVKSQGIQFLVSGKLLVNAMLQDRLFWSKGWSIKCEHKLQEKFWRNFTLTFHVVLTGIGRGVFSLPCMTFINYVKQSLHMYI